MNARDRVRRVLAGEVPDRIPWSVGYWDTTEARWHREGLPPGVSAREYFHTDDIERVEGDLTLQLPERTVDSDGDARTYWDRNGALRRDLRTEEGRTSQWLDFSIRTREDWARYRDRLKLTESRVTPRVLQAAERARRENRALFYQAHACFSATWAKIGMSNEMMFMITDPGFIRDMYEAHIQLVIDLYEEMVRRGLEFDAAFLADDLGATAASLISPALYRELVFPCHRRLCTYFAKKGLRTMLHSDGNVSAFVPHFLDAGFSGLHPLEAKAGMDVRWLRGEYGDGLLLWGNIDVTKLAGGSHAEIRDEIMDKIPVAKEGGGYVYSVDHGGVPRDIAFEDYRYAMALVRECGGFD